MSHSVWKSYATTILLGVGLLARGVPAAEQPLFWDPKGPAEQRVEDLLNRLTLEEKIRLLHSELNEGREGNFQSGGVPRLNIRRLSVTDGPVGVRTFDSTAATALPCTLALSCTWDVEAARAYGRLIGEEALALGKQVVFGPGVNLMRSPLGARNFEYMGEDPFLCGTLASAYIKSMQDLGVAACAKHLLANDYDSKRHFTSSNMDDRTLRETHMLPFEMAVRDGGAWAVMTGNNLVNGTHVAENRRILEELIKGELRFDGVMLTDWRSAYTAVPSALAGLDITMGFCGYVYGNGELLAAVKSGEVPQASITEKARRLLRLYVRTGMLDPEKGKGSLDSAEHQAAARRLASEGIVLLKNERDLLPIQPSGVRHVLVTGPGTQVVPFGKGSSAVKSSKSVTPLEGITAALGTAKINHVAWDRRKVGERKSSQGDSAPMEAPDRAVLESAARAADLVLFFALDPTHGESTDLTSFDLPFSQAEAISSLAAANSNLAVVVMSGEPISVEPWADQVPAIITAWYGGQSTGEAIADVLTGKVSPGGKLSCTFGKRIEDYACHSLDLWPPRLILEKPPRDAGYKPEERKALYAYAADYREGTMIGYRWFDHRQIEPRFAFGHGLSYTTFSFSDLKTARDNSGIRVTCKVTNNGKRAGSEVVQVYVSPGSSSVERPPRELKGFTKVTLKPGETRQVTVQLRPTALAYYDANSKKWRAEAGKYKIQAGASCRDIRLESLVTLEEERLFDSF
jgi:beta-glucosidase